MEINTGHVIALQERVCINCKRDPASRNIEAKTQCSIWNKAFLEEDYKHFKLIDNSIECKKFIDIKDKTQKKPKKLKKDIYNMFE